MSGLGVEQSGGRLRNSIVLTGEKSSGPVRSLFQDVAEL